jgi:hypothetical protein
MNTQLPQLKTAALYLDKLVILDPVGASWVTIGADHHARGVKQLQDAGTLQTGALVGVLTKCGHEHILRFIPVTLLLASYLM